jgi:chromosome segregation ATPase
MAEIEVQKDLKAVTEKMEALVDELNQVNALREQHVAKVLKNEGKIELLREKDTEGDPQEEVPDVIKWKENKLKSVTEKKEVLVQELNKVNAHREQLVGQVQNLQGVLMYLRGKDDTPEVINEGGVPDEVVEAAKEAIKGKTGDKDS